MHAMKLLSAAVWLALAAGPAVAGINTDPLDYVPAPAGTTLAAIYYQNNHSSSQYADGRQVAQNSIQADVGIARFVHYTELAGFRIAPQVLLPAVSVEVGGKGNTVSADGISDPILGLPVWLVNRPEQRLYFAVTPYLHLPLGRYNSNRALNPGDNRWKFTLQGGLSVGLGEKTTLDVIGDAQWFGDNRDIAGGGHLEQKALYSLQPQLTYQLAPGLTSSLGVYHVWGGASQVRGVDQHDRTRTTTALGTLSYWLGKTDNLQFQYRVDTEVKNGAKTNGLQLRFLHVF